MTADVGSGLAPASEPGGRTEWWRTVTPGELRASSAVVSKFLEGRGAAAPAEIEAFARALALRQLLVDDTSVWKSADRAYDLMPEVPREPTEVEVVRAAEAWLPRGDALDAGFTRCLELLRPQDRREWAALLRRFRMNLYLLKSDCLSAVVDGGLQSPKGVSVPVKAGPRKV